MKQQNYNIIDSFSEGKACKQLIKEKSERVLVKGLVGSSVILALTSYSQERYGIFIIVMDDKDSAAYASNDLTELVGENSVMFFPSVSKRSAAFEGEELSSIVLRTSALTAMSNIKESERLYIITYPEAISEKVVTTETIQSNSFELIVGRRDKIDSIVEILLDYDFKKVDFVFEPGQFSVRGGIVDIFSYSENQPYRIDFFGDEIESIRIFDVSSQRSQRKVESVIIVPYIRELTDASLRISLVDFISTIPQSKTTFWLSSPNHIISRLDDIYNKLVKKQIESSVDKVVGTSQIVISGDEFVNSLAEKNIIYLRDEIKTLAAYSQINFNTSVQPTFNKNFELIANDIDSNLLKGYKTYILTKNKAQVERLENIFNSLGKKDVMFENISQTLHTGFIDNDTRCCYYTDHQIFERFHKYKINREIKKSESIAISELNALSIGDYIVHIDHGVAKFGGLVRSIESGKSVESIKLLFRDNDILLVNVHSLHKISKYRDKDSESPKLHKLGSSVWQKFKSTTKSKVKDIAKDLIALYAKRRAEKGFAFSENSYMQQELEASFIYEDTPDQQTTTESIYKDMESITPMDRLVCGDVGYGKTEIAIRAAFKAVCDNKQVAVLVPTTVLSMQHYRTFSKRLKEFPVRIESLSRSKTSSEVKDIIKDLSEGKIDIIIGTHKILSKEVKFKDLGLVIVDEEQKFGVTSKEKLKSIKSNVDTVTLTATPIPRTLQFSLMGARDLSIINTPPPNRQPVTTELHPFSNEIIKEVIDAEIARGGQIFFLHNRVKDIEHIAAIIQKLSPNARCVVAHGQMAPSLMEHRMMDFIYGEYDVLIATTIIESGIDIPNANTIIINNAQNFGLSDLHQLRGRVGRTNTKAYCYLLIPENCALSENAHKRIKAIEDFSDLGSGFNIAMQDLDIRGAGNILGGEQSGFISDIGFETYYKILSEAIMELKNESDIEITEPQQNDSLLGESGSNWTQQSAAYISDCQIDIDVEAIIPDNYISSINEKINLYKQIDRLTTKKEADDIKENLIDRFGALPEPTQALFDIVLIRRIALELGFEKIIIKNGFFIINFVRDQSSSYYKSAIFSSMMEYISGMADRYKLKHRDGKLLLSISGIRSLDDALNIAENMKNYVKQKIN